MCLFVLAAVIVAYLVLVGHNVAVAQTMGFDVLSWVKSLPGALLSLVKGLASPLLSKVQVLFSGAKALLSNAWNWVKGLLKLS